MLRVLSGNSRRFTTTSVLQLSPPSLINGSQDVAQITHIVTAQNSLVWYWNRNSCFGIIFTKCLELDYYDIFKKSRDHRKQQRERGTRIVVVDSQASITHAVSGCSPDGTTSCRRLRRGCVPAGPCSSCGRGTRTATSSAPPRSASERSRLMSSWRLQPAKTSLMMKLPLGFETAMYVQLSFAAFLSSGAKKNLKGHSIAQLCTWCFGVLYTNLFHVTDAA